MKNIFIVMCALLLLVPPVQAHADAIILESVNETHIEALETSHQDMHHQNDNEEEKDSKHHHHCTMLGFSYAVISPNTTYNLIAVLQIKKAIIFHKFLHASNNLERLFQPPRIG